MTADHRERGCYSCDHRAIASPAARDAVLRTKGWTVAHAFNATLRGWLVLVPARHVLSLADLTPGEAEELGGLVRRMSVALGSVTGCVKTYLMQFSEAEGFAHLHVHLVPRMPDQPEDVRGPRVFAHLSEDENAWLSERERDEVALAVRAADPGV